MWSASIRRPAKTRCPIAFPKERCSATLQVSQCSFSYSSLPQQQSWIPRKGTIRSSDHRWYADIRSNRRRALHYRGSNQLEHYAKGARRFSKVPRQPADLAAPPASPSTSTSLAPTPVSPEAGARDAGAVGAINEISTAAIYSTLLTRAAMAAGMVYACTEYCYDITLCEGPSMTPTIRRSGEIVLVDKWSCRRYGMADGCVGEDRAAAARARQEAFERDHPDSSEEWHDALVSVSDLPSLSTLRSWQLAWRQSTSPLAVGDVVVVRHPARKRGTVCKRVLGLPGDQVLDKKLLVVPDGHVWLEGDNTLNSSDSRSYGPVPAALVVGRVVARLWPLRGRALILSGAPPLPAPGEAFTGSTVLPAGYEGQRIVKKNRNQNDNTRPRKRKTKSRKARL